MLEIKNYNSLSTPAGIKFFLILKKRTEAFYEAGIL